MRRAVNWKSICLRAATLAPFLVTVLLCLLLKESYPFSHFPMYSTFSDRTYYVYVADADGSPIPVQSITYLRTSRIKKVYDGHLGRIRSELGKDKRSLTTEERSPAGQATLEWLYGATRDEMKPTLDRLRGLRLYQVDVTLEDGETVEHPPELVGEIRLPDGGARPGVPSGTAPGPDSAIPGEEGAHG